MNFDDPKLIAKYGTWIRAQVAFYDFIFQAGTELCAAHWKELSRQEVSDQFADGGDLYERSIIGIEKVFPTAEAAWLAFIQEAQ